MVKLSQELLEKIKKETEEYNRSSRTVPLDVYDIQQEYGKHFGGECLELIYFRMESNLRASKQKRVEYINIVEQAIQDNKRIPDDYWDKVYNKFPEGAKI